MKNTSNTLKTTFTGILLDETFNLTEEYLNINTIKLYTVTLKSSQIDMLLKAFGINKDFIKQSCISILEHAKQQLLEKKENFDTLLLSMESSLLPNKTLVAIWDIADHEFLLLLNSIDPLDYLLNEENDDKYITRKIS